MKFSGMEDRLNPIRPADADESTVAGYSAIHGRAAGLEGSDGLPYTVAIETERTETGYTGYLVFVRWAENSTAIMGHLDSGDLGSGETEAEARADAGRTKLTEARKILDGLIAEREEWAR